MSDAMTPYRPGAFDSSLQSGASQRPATPAAREERLRTLYEKWEQFTREYGPARERNDQEVMTNLRGLLVLIKKEILRLGGTVPVFPDHYSRHHLADL
jgi:tRNA C32,U32 (ribose-2'-O)-methylase TrmJ